MTRPCDRQPRGKSAEARPPRQLNVLMVEDSENDALLIADALGRAGYDVSWKRVESAAELRAALQKSAWHVILSDHRLPGFSAREAFEICREAGRNAPFVIVSGVLEEKLAAAARKAGIRAWVSKDDLGALAEVLARECGAG